jgi:hypothetical protein
MNTEAIKQAVHDQCPNGYRMVIRNQGDWTAISKAVNQGIDSYLEGFAQSTFDNDTGKCNIHPDEVHILVRRLLEDSSERSEDLGRAILSTLGLEEV